MSWFPKSGKIWFGRIAVALLNASPFFGRWNCVLFGVPFLGLLLGVHICWVSTYLFEAENACQYYLTWILEKRKCCVWKLTLKTGLYQLPASVATNFLRLIGSETCSDRFRGAPVETCIPRQSLPIISHQQALFLSGPCPYQFRTDSLSCLGAV